ncbi:hypothetical protein VCR12J2_1030089 [Vibrio coralliirubri]|uniref:helix-turn-helix domain-containing protein n=1 Tax=Vibrio coralliirubri TaxID=1516159 RepID=UPI00062F9CFA|nr:helix-turn-helix domain-containing protein [Vibrio coralliirubri]CDT80751.1 hypothetical protein VCR12J2_1030089 [Vibrio coralliirubri]
MTLTNIKKTGRPSLSKEIIKQIAELVAQKYTHQSIADHLGVSLSTVKIHRLGYNMRKYKSLEESISGQTTASLEVLE